MIKWEHSIFALPFALCGAMLAADVILAPVSGSLFHTTAAREAAAAGFPPERVETIRLMNAHFAKAAENASRDYRNLKEFSENASHEIQTPLACHLKRIEGCRAVLTSSIGSAVTLVSTVGPEIWPVKLDANEFELAMVNLTINALQSTSHPHRVTVSCQLHPSPIDLKKFPDSPTQRMINRDGFANRTPILTGTPWTR